MPPVSLTVFPFWRTPPHATTSRFNRRRRCRRRLVACSAWSKTDFVWTFSAALGLWLIFAAARASLPACQGPSPCFEICWTRHSDVAFKCFQFPWRRNLADKLLNEPGQPERECVVIRVEREEIVDPRSLVLAETGGVQPYFLASLYVCDFVGI